MADPTSRMLRLLSLLQTHRHWAGPELADRLEVSERTLRRDVDRLRELGYPVDATRGTDGGYQLAAGSQLPPLLLDDDEAVAAAFVEAGLQSAWAPAEAEVTVAVPLDEVVGYSPMSGLSLEAVDATSCRLRLRADSFEWLAVVVALLPFAILAVEPPVLRDQLQTMVDRLTPVT